MARDQEPVTDDELQEGKERLRKHRQKVREALAEDLGGDSEDYDPRAQTDVDGDADRDTAESD